MSDTIERFEKKLDALIKENQAYKMDEKNYIIAMPKYSEYKDLHEFKFYDEIIVTSGFYEGKEGYVVAIKDEFPESIDHRGGKAPMRVKTYSIKMKDPFDTKEDLIVLIDAKLLEIKE